MKKINISFSSEKEKENFVLECEKNFHKRLRDVSEKVVGSGADIILLSGPTCSGKTTLANKIIRDFGKINKRVIVISLDDFFLDRFDMRKVDENKRIDYDSIDALDFACLSKCIADIKAKGEFSVPKYDFLTQSRVSYTNYTFTENTVIMLEGIQAVYPEITSLFSENDHIGIFANVENDVEINGVCFCRDDIRLSRRIVRDKKFRGATADFSLYLWEGVRENEDKCIYPNKNICTVQMDSFLEYELFVLKDYIIDILKDVEVGSKYYTKARELTEKFSRIDSISYDYTPKNSLYTEFLGKK